MPERIAPPCTMPRCPHRKPCPVHGKRGPDFRPSPTDRGYDARWRTTRASYLERHPICDWAACLAPATDVHHSDGQGPRGDNSDANLQALCHPHHSSVTASR